MKYDYASDLHVDINGDKSYPWQDEKRNDILILNGDTSNSIELTMSVVNDAARHYKHVFFNDGNHEHYNPKSSTDLNMKYFEDNSTENVAYFNGTSKQIDSTLFVGACGWYDFTMTDHLSREQQHQLWKEELNDSRMIRFHMYPDKLALLQATQIRDIVTDAQDDDTVKEIVIFTHTCPIREGLYDGPNYLWVRLNGSYGNNHMRMVREADQNKKIKVWHYGHTHIHNDFVQDGIRYVNNARGYVNHERNGFNGIMSIDTDETFSYEDLFSSMESDV